MKIINYGHACFLVEYNGVKLLFDPYQDESVPGLKLNKIETNYCFISHDHHDHNALCFADIKEEIVPTYKVIEIPHDKADGKLRGMNKIHIVRMDDFVIAHFGDIGVLPSDLEPFKDIDIILLPINGYYTIGALEALELFNKIQAKVLIPMHFYDKNLKTGYEDGNQIDILIESSNNINFIENDEIELNKNHKGIYVFKKVRSEND